MGQFSPKVATVAKIILILSNFSLSYCYFERLNSNSSSSELPRTYIVINYLDLKTGN